MRKLDENPQNKYINKYEPMNNSDHEVKVTLFKSAAFYKKFPCKKHESS